MGTSERVKASLNLVELFTGMSNEVCTFVHLYICTLIVHFVLVIIGMICIFSGLSKQN